MNDLRYFRSFLGEWLAIDAKKKIRPDVYYGSHLGELYQMYLLGQDNDQFTIKNPHPVFSWQNAKIQIRNDQPENRILVVANSLDQPIFSPVVPNITVGPNFHLLPSTRAVLGFWRLHDQFVCMTGLEYYKNDVNTVRVYVGREGKMRQIKVVEHKGTIVVTDEAVLDTHLKTMGGYSLSPSDIKYYLVTESDEVLSVTRLGTI